MQLKAQIFSAMQRNGKNYLARLVRVPHQKRSPILLCFFTQPKPKSLRSAPIVSMELKCNVPNFLSFFTWSVITVTQRSATIVSMQLKAYHQCNAARWKKRSSPALLVGVRHLPPSSLRHRFTGATASASLTLCHKQYPSIPFCQCQYCCYQGQW